jgi:ribosomal-protein-alanine N-acetyltransferase
MEIKRNIQTDRLILSPVSWTDIVFFFRLMGNSRVRRFLGGAVPLSKRLRRFKLYRLGHPKAGIWMVRTKTPKRLIGMIELTPHRDGVEYEVSYQFHPSSWGSGFAAEATVCIVKHAMKDLGFERIIAETQTANDRSCHMLERIGFIEIDDVERFGARQTVYSKSACDVQNT